MPGGAQRQPACRGEAAARQALLFRQLSGFCTLAEMFENLLFARPALLVQAEQFVRPLVRFHGAGQLDQQARDQRAVDLDLDAAGVLAEQVATRQDAFEPAEKQLDQPAIAVQKDEDFRRHIEEIGDQDDVLGGRLAFAAATFGMVRDAHDDAPLEVIGMFDPLGLRRAHPSDGVLQNTGRGGNISRRFGLEVVVVADAADVAAACLDDVVVQRELLVAAVNDIATIGGKRCFEHGLFAGLALSRGVRDSSETRHAAKHLEMGVQLPAPVLAPSKTCLRDLRQLEQEATVHGRGHMGQFLQARIGGGRLRDLAEQFLEDRDQQLRVEQMHRLGQRTQRDLRAPQLATHGGQAASAMQIAEGFHRGIKERQENQPAHMVKEQTAIAGSIPLALRGPQAFPKRRKPLQVSQALNRRQRFQCVRFVSHSHPCQFGRKSYETYPWRKFRAEQDWDKPAVAPARITLVCDNLNTHTKGAFYEAFPPAKARDYVRRINFVYTPKHGSWLNVAECELSCMTSQCLKDRRIGDIETLQTEIAAWSIRVNAKQRAVDWQFTLDKARGKLKRLYPNI